MITLPAYGRVLPLGMIEHARSCWTQAHHASIFMRMTHDQLDYPAGHTDVERLVGLRVRELRAARGWSQEALGRRMTSLGYPMHQTTVAKLEAGTRPLRVSELVALADILGVKPRGLLSPAPIDKSALLEAEKHLTALTNAVQTAHAHLEMLEGERMEAVNRVLALRAEFDDE